MSLLLDNSGSPDNAPMESVVDDYSMAEHCDEDDAGVWKTSEERERLLASTDDSDAPRDRWGSGHELAASCNRANSLYTAHLA